MRSCLSLLLITLGAIAYIITDREFQANGFAAYTWVMIWWFVLIFQLTCVRHMHTCALSPHACPTHACPSRVCCHTRPTLVPAHTRAAPHVCRPALVPPHSRARAHSLVSMCTVPASLLPCSQRCSDGKFLVTGIELVSLWTPVLYTNTFSIIPAMLVCYFAGELNPERPDDLQITNASLLWLGLSCVIGIGISWAGFWCQSLVSATKYTVVGVMNKMLTVTLNVLVWDKHASPAGIFALGLCLIGGSLCLQPEVHTVHPLSHYFPICMHPVH